MNNGRAVGDIRSRDTIGQVSMFHEIPQVRFRNTDKFVSYTNANKEGAGIDVNRARFRFIPPGTPAASNEPIIFSYSHRPGFCR